MNVVTLVAAERGRRCLHKIGQMLEEQDRLTVFTFPEAPWEPPFVGAIEELSLYLKSHFYVTSKVHDEVYDEIWEAKPDIIFVVGWRYLIPAKVYESAKIGCFVFHDSLLPEYRGFGPTVWAMRNGETHTGASLFKIVEEMDEGPIVAQRRVDILPEEYISDVTERVTLTYIDMLEKVLPKLKSGAIELTEQDHEKATYTCKTLPSDFKIDWSSPVAAVHNFIRAYSEPYPGAYCFLDGKKITILSADIDNSRKYVGLFPGRVIDIVKGEGVRIAASNGILLIKDIRVDDGNKVNVAEVIKRISTTLS